MPRLPGATVPPMSGTLVEVEVLVEEAGLRWLGGPGLRSMMIDENLARIDFAPAGNERLAALVYRHEGPERESRALELLNRAAELVAGYGLTVVAYCWRWA
jgi:hypothetical protein